MTQVRSKEEALFLQTDRRRQLQHWGNQHFKSHMYQTDEREYRYEERAGNYQLKCWHDGNETTDRGLLNQRPEWLVRIVDTAVLGGHLKRISQPPPDAVVWFTTDLNNNLNNFLELT